MISLSLHDGKTSICQKCGTYNLTSATFCSVCGAFTPEACNYEAPLNNAEGRAVNVETNAKSSSLDNLLLLLAVLLFAGSCVALVGIIPVLIMAVGAIQAFRSGDVKNMRVSARFVQIVLSVASLGFLCLLAYEYNGSDFSFDYSLGWGAVIGSLASAVLIQVLWIAPFERQLPVWRAASVLRRAKNIKTEKNRIIGRDSLAPYSIADKLLKWSKLREDGLVTEGEYQDARTKLLGR